jgi:hypothetical protein
MNRRRVLHLASSSAFLALTNGIANRVHAQEPSSRTKERIVALVRTYPGAEAKARPVQKIEPVAMQTDSPEAASAAPVFDHFVGDLHLRYVFDDPKFMVALRGHDLKRLGVNRDALAVLAVENYRRLYPKLTVIRPEPSLGVVTDGGQLEPCILLDGRFWERQSASFGGELIASAPARDAVVFTTREPRQNIELLKHLAVQLYEKAGSQALSRTVFAWRYWRWEVIA